MKTQTHSAGPVSYLIRFYRRDPADPEAVVGTLQTLSEEHTQSSFRTRRELLQQLGIGDEACDAP